MGRLHQRSCLILGAFWLVLPGTVWASPPDMEVLLTGQVETDASGEQVVALRFLDRTDRQEILALPDRIEAKVRQENRERTLLLARANGRSEERSGGQECVSTGSARWCTYH